MLEEVEVEFGAEAAGELEAEVGAFGDEVHDGCGFGVEAALSLGELEELAVLGGPVAGVGEVEEGGVEGGEVGVGGVAGGGGSGGLAVTPDEVEAAVGVEEELDVGLMGADGVEFDGVG